MPVSSPSSIYTPSSLSVLSFILFLYLSLFVHKSKDSVCSCSRHSSVNKVGRRMEKCEEEEKTWRRITRDKNSNKGYECSLFITKSSLFSSFSYLKAIFFLFLITSSPPFSSSSSDGKRSIVKENRGENWRRKEEACGFNSLQSHTIVFYDSRAKGEEKVWNIFRRGRSDVKSWVPLLFMKHMLGLFSLISSLSLSLFSFHPSVAPTLLFSVWTKLKAV